MRDKVTRLTAAITLAEKTCKSKSVCSAKADVVFLLDSSGSVGATNFKKMLQFMQGVVSKFSVGLNNIQVGVDTFQSTVKSEFKLNQFLDKNDLITAIGNIVYKTGGTKTGSAIKFMTTYSFSTTAGHRTGVPKIGIVITDGKSNDQANTLAESKKARASGIQLIAIGVGDGINTIELEGIANKPKTEYVYNVKNFDVLNILQSSLSARTCKVDGGWSNNDPWSACTKTCGDGTRTRTRTCTNPSPSKGGAPCNGSAIQSEACNINPCPVDGGWSNNNPWAACTKTCGDGTRTRTRTCSNPSPSKGGAPCKGSAIQSEACNINPCPVCSAKADVVFLLDSSGSVGATNFKKMLQFMQGVVNKFSVGLNNIQVGVDTFQSTVKSEFKLNQFLDKNDLITAIGNIVYKTGGTKTGSAIKFMTTYSFSTTAGHRTGVPKIGIVITDGKSNDQANTLAESKKARASGIQLISIGVGDGINTIELEGIANKPKTEYVYNVKNFDVLNILQSSLSARTCKVDGGWSNNDPWSACTKTCGDGTRTRTRTCTNPSPSKGGAPCNGSAIQSEACNINPCPVDGGWSYNDPWSACTTTCGDGTRTRTRTCTNPSPSKGGAPCKGSAIQSEACNINPCPACPSGWTMYGSSCYFFSHTSEKWTDAVRICQTKNSILAEIGSSGENGFLKNTASNYGGKFWLGEQIVEGKETGIGGPVVRDSV
ncbi:collagen, type VI, alpha [Mytilus galloprovincialis]|uniref:Collagen, type VI, alpha n=1 Tax=Mytilus galloprovincialis TaxID=29158 RepID=A0A8B6CK83_MYTGA|nr:collagen, type VI, alpha [Mytilus galloprovincialis]